MIGEETILRRLEKAYTPMNLIDPLIGIQGFRWFSQRITEGSCGPLASRERSLQFEVTSGKSILRIKEIRNQWQQKIEVNSNSAEIEKNKKLIELEKTWQKLPKGKKEEQTWVEEAVGMASAFFEKFRKEKDPNFIEMYDNQLYYIMLMSLGKGKFDNGLEIALKKHGVQLDTGEGKTISTALVAAVRAMRGERVHIIEQNYLSAIGHAQETAPFLNQFLHKDVGVVTDVSNYKDRNEQEIQDGENSPIRVLPDGQIVDTRLEKSLKILRVQPSGDAIKNIQSQLKKYQEPHDLQVDKKGIIVKPQRDGENRDSFLWIDGKRKDIKGLEGRVNCWQRAIVYCDLNSLGGDVTKDKVIHPTRQFGPQNLSGVTAIVQEADALMFDWASTQFIIEGGATKGILAWEEYTKLLGLKDFKKAAYFSWDIWRLISQLGPALDNSINGEKYMKTPEGGIMISEDVITAVQKVIEDQFIGDKELHNSLKKNPQIVKAALEIFIGFKPREKYIPGKTEPVLMDRYNLPLDKRELQGLYDLFIQFSNFFEQEGFFQKPPSNEELNQLIEKSFFSIKASTKTLARVLPITLFNQYGNLVFTSGSLLPIASQFKDLYNAEVLTVNRHQPLASEDPPKDNRLYTKTLDGGMAEIDFISKGLRSRLVYEIIKDIQSNGRAGLIIMPDIESAYQLNEQLSDYFDREGIPEPMNYRKDRQIKLITGKEEQESKGLLNRIVANLKPGDIVITTQIAHRDVDPRPNDELVKNGGYESIICDPPNERGLWQSLQRALRFNIPGKRRLIITGEEIKKVANRSLLPAGPSSIFEIRDAKKLEEKYKERLKQFDNLWSQAEQGDLEAQKNLFSQYLDYLRLGEDRVANQLQYLFINDCQLEKWQKHLINKIEKHKGWMTESEVLAAYEVGLLKELASLKSHSYIAMSDIDQKKIQKLASKQYEVQERILGQYWSEFLRYIDQEFSLFMIAPYGPFTGGQAISQGNIASLMSAWDYQVEKIIKKWKPPHLFTELKANISKVEYAKRRLTRAKPRAGKFGRKNKSTRIL